MAGYMRALGWVLVVTGLAASVACWRGVSDDEAYYKALKGLSKYPNNVLYVTDLKLAEPRHMLLLAGAYGFGAVGLVLGSMCLALGTLVSRSSVP